MGRHIIPDVPWYYDFLHVFIFFLWLVVEYQILNVSVIKNDEISNRGCTIRMLCTYEQGY